MMHLIISRGMNHYVVTPLVTMAKSHTVWQCPQIPDTYNNLSLRTENNREPDDLKHILEANE